ncbi:class II glutamine amidotransferase [uncultured Tateyamaria sp.]|uniref:class II glutamine amidotransferase n=1 Tax=uncultured Tateyamaria sp. TaxID=455651 RepID=UPI002624F853|nr:class II glutamine amidotransferase [uncultured Tateyamaria sp.]
MCRWAAWQGAPLFLGQIVTAPDHSLIEQSRDASKCKTAINADGFGLAWYDQRPEPGLYRDVFPAWSDPNLKSLAEQVRARLFMAHVRASTGTATSRNNCHPFTRGNWTFMHNGQVGGFDSFRRRAEGLISDADFAHRKGATDSEALFLTACARGLEADPKAALGSAVATFEQMSREAGAGPHMRLTAALSDGHTLYAVRYASDDFAPSLFYQWSAEWGGWAVVSEPFDTVGGTWKEVPKGSFCTFTPTACQIERFEPTLVKAAA